MAPRIARSESRAADTDRACPRRPAGKRVYRLVSLVRRWAGGARRVGRRAAAAERHAADRAAGGRHARRGGAAA
eukprot:3873225-Prymnesium_polylepis.1